MNLKQRYLIVVLVTFYLIIINCGHKESASLHNTSPVKVMNKFFEGWKNKDKKLLKSLFYSKIPDKIVNDYINELFSIEVLLKYKISKKVTYNDGLAEVKTKFLFMQVKPENNLIDKDIAKKVQKTQNFILKEENSIWKIRQFNENWDKKVEDAIFLDCLEVLMDFSIALESFRKKNNSYTEDLELLDFTKKPKFSFCKTIPKIKVEKTKYLISAITNNLTHCELIVTPSSYYPKSYDKCSLN